MWEFVTIALCTIGFVVVGAVVTVELPLQLTSGFYRPAVLRQPPNRARR